MGQRRGWWGGRGLFSCLLLVIEVSLAGQLPDRTGQREFARSVGLVHILGREDRLRSEKGTMFLMKQSQCGGLELQIYLMSLGEQQSL